ncbi:MAG: NAD-dependent deacylase [Chloroflexi bacterium]|nr:NAD-dependent deacylase [Chloroflexota bacterium]
MEPSQIAAVAAILKRSQRLVVSTGAGVSKESGIPTFRDALEGLWAQYDPQKLATPRGFLQNPKLVWDWYAHRRALLADAKPNPGHYALAEMEALVPQLVLVTQNIDGLHQEAGSSDVVLLHGDIRLNKCHANCQGNPTHINIEELEWDRNAGPPVCPRCGAWVRPDVVWYEELLPPAAIERAFNLSEVADVMLVVGTSGVTQPAASLPFAAKRAGGTLIEVNPEPSQITAIADHYLPGPSGEVLPQIVAAMRALGDMPGAQPDA